MKENLIKALFAAIAVAIGNTLVILLKGEKISIFTMGLCGLVTFIVDYIWSLIFNKKQR